MKTQRTYQHLSVRSLLARHFWKAGAAFLPVVALSGAWYVYANRVPQVSIPLDAAPTEIKKGSGFALLVAAGERISDADGARIYAGIARNTETQRREFGGRIPTLADKEAVVTKNAAALREMRKALQMPIRPTVAATFTDETAYPNYAKVRGLARLLHLEAAVYQEKKEYGRAAQSLMDAQQMGIAMQNHAPLIPSLVGMACEAIGRRPMWGLTEHLSASEARTAARRLEEIESARQSAAMVFEEEKWGMTRGLMADFTRYSLSETAIRMREAIDPDWKPSTAQKIPLGIYAMLKPKAAVVADMQAYMDTWIARAGEPYQAGAREPVPISWDYFSRVLFPVMEAAIHKQRDTQAQSALLTAHLALHAYRLEHGAYPESLDKLVAEGYLARVPSDPFAPTLGAPLHYQRREDGTCLLYSLGPDGDDDNGVPLDNHDKSGKYRPWADPDNKGDYVVGINLHSNPF